MLALPAAGEQWVYVWQQAWTPAVNAALGTTAPMVDGLMVLVAEGATDAAGDTTSRRPNIDWPLLATLDTPVVAVVRVDVGFTNQLRNTPAGAWDWLVAALAPAQAAAAAAGVAIAGVQLDYDCPTERLPDYAAFLEEAPGLVGDFSITTLPDWLGRPGFDALLAQVDHYVLQVHGLEQPQDRDDPVVLCDPDRARRWVARASALGVPFRVALPTYGYRLFFDRAGGFAGLGAEGTASTLAGATSRALHADPVAMGALAKELRGNPPAHFQGLTWFRMPVVDDTLNWNAAVWQAVLQGETLTHVVDAVLDWPQPRLLELTVRNTGITQPAGRCEVVVALPWSAVAAHDTHNGFHLEHKADGSTLLLTGAAPAPGTEKVAGWFRFRDAVATEGVVLGKVTVQP